MTYSYRNQSTVALRLAYSYRLGAALYWMWPYIQLIIRMLSETSREKQTKQIKKKIFQIINTAHDATSKATVAIQINNKIQTETIRPLSLIKLSNTLIQTTSRLFLLLLLFLLLPTPPPPLPGVWRFRKSVSQVNLNWIERNIQIQIPTQSALDNSMPNWSERRFWYSKSKTRINQIDLIRSSGTSFLPLNLVRTRHNQIDNIFSISIHMTFFFKRKTPSIWLEALNDELKHSIETGGGDRCSNHSNNNNNNKSASYIRFNQIKRPNESDWYRPPFTRRKTWKQMVCFCGHSLVHFLLFIPSEREEENRVKIKKSKSNDPWWSGGMQVIGLRLSTHHKSATLLPSNS